jgi:hypothetical protein
VTSTIKMRCKPLENEYEKERMRLTDLHARRGVPDTGNKAVLYGICALVANSESRRERNSVVERCSPDVANGVTDGSVDSEWHVSETGTFRSDEDCVDRATASWRRERSLAFHAHGTWRSTVLDHAFWNNTISVSSV